MLGPFQIFQVLIPTGEWRVTAAALKVANAWGSAGAYFGVPHPGLRAQEGVLVQDGQHLDVPRSRDASAAHDILPETVTKLPAWRPRELTAGGQQTCPSV